MKFINTRLLRLFGLLFCLAFTAPAFAQCDDDTVPPVPICINNLHVTAVPGVGITIWAEDVNEGSYDDCSAVSLEIVLAANDNGTPPGTESIDLPDVSGSYFVILYAIDEAGNASACFTNINLDGNVSDCTQDDEAPNLICINGLTFTADPVDGVNIFASEFIAQATDNCDQSLSISINRASESTGQPQGEAFLHLTTDDDETIAVEIWVEDDFGNIASCETYLLLQEGVGCDMDTTPPIAICDAEFSVFSTPGLGATITTGDIDEGSYDQCSSVSLQLVLSTDDTSMPPGTTSVNIPDVPGDYNVVLYAIDQAGNFSACFTTVSLLDGSNPDICDDDTIAPSVVCESETYIAWTQEDLASLQATELNEGSFDFCSGTNLTFNINLGEANTGSPSGETEITFQTPGIYSVAMYAIDEAGNFNSCFSAVHVQDVFGECENDNEAPSLVCITTLSAILSPQGEVAIFAQDVINSTSDNCDANLDLNINFLSESTGMPSGLTAILISEEGTYELESWAIDNAGNFNSCATTLIVEGNGNGNDCDPDDTPPVPICNNGFSVEIDPVAGATISAADLDEGSFDFCSSVTLSIEQTSDPSPVMPTTESITVYETGIFPVIVWVADESGNTSQCWTIVSVDGVSHPIAGQVFREDNDNCILDGTEDSNGLSGWTVRATNTTTGTISTTQTVDNGSYVLGAINDGGEGANDFLIEVVMPNGFGASCPTSILVEDVGDLTIDINFPVKLIEDCNYLTVDVSAPFIRRCFANEYYINYTNYSNFAVEDATVNLQLDQYMDFVSADAPYVDLGNGQLEFTLGTIPAGFSGQISFTVNVSCEAELGATHCVEAIIQPFTCIPAEGFAELMVIGECDPVDDEVNFTIRNIGDGPMLSPQNHIIIEDVVMYMTGDTPIQLDAGEDATFSLPATGATWRLAIGQDESFPFGGVAAAFVEGCGGFTPGMATQFSLSSSKPNAAEDCQENIGSWDPNDKQAFPKGYGEENYLEANTTINYLIRFQNTGTDTAFNVRVEDQLSELLDPTTLVPGASSHPYRMELREEGQLIFHFDNIMLPDSNINTITSNGFIKFQIDQLADNPIGSRIENTAAIFFDFNEAVMTNTTHHTIGENFVVVATQNIQHPGLQLTVAPNPLQTYTNLRIEGYNSQDAYCLIYDAHGRQILQTPFQGGEAQLKRSDFGSAGLYYYQIIDQNHRLVQGKLIVK